MTHKSSSNRFHLFNSSKYVAVFDGLWIMLQEGQKNSTADLIIALHFQHSLSFGRRLLFALLAYLLYCSISSHVFLDPEIELFMVSVGKKAAIVRINLLPNILCSAYHHLAHISSNFNGKTATVLCWRQKIASHFVGDITCTGTQRIQRIQYGLVPKVNKDGDNDVTKNIIFLYVSKK